MSRYSHSAVEDVRFGSRFSSIGSFPFATLLVQKRARSHINARLVLEYFLCKFSIYLCHCWLRLLFKTWSHEHCGIRVHNEAELFDLFVVGQVVNRAAAI